VGPAEEQPHLGALRGRFAKARILLRERGVRFDAQPHGLIDPAVDDGCGLAVGQFPGFHRGRRRGGRLCEDRGGQHESSDDSGDPPAGGNQDIDVMRTGHGR
jgi:hypothetical protein